MSFQIHDYETILKVLPENKRISFLKNLSKIRRSILKSTEQKDFFKKYLSIIFGLDDDLKEFFLYVMLHGTQSYEEILEKCRIDISREKLYKLEEESGLLVFDKKPGQAGQKRRNKVYPTYVGFMILDRIYNDKKILQKEDFSLKKASGLLIEKAGKTLEQREIKQARFSSTERKHVKESTADDTEPQILLLYSELSKKWTFPGKLYRKDEKKNDQKLLKDFIEHVFKTKKKDITQLCADKGIVFPRLVCKFGYMDTAYDADLFEIKSSKTDINQKFQKENFVLWSDLGRTQQDFFSYDEILSNRDISQKPKCYVAALKIMKELKDNAHTNDNVLSDMIKEWINTSGLKLDSLEEFYRLNEKNEELFAKRVSDVIRNLKMH